MLYRVIPCYTMNISGSKGLCILGYLFLEDFKKCIPFWHILRRRLRREHRLNSFTIFACSSWSFIGLPQDARKEGLKAKIHTYPLFGGVFVFSHWLNHLESTNLELPRCTASSLLLETLRALQRCKPVEVPTELRGGSMWMGQKMTEEPGPSPNSCGWVVLWQGLLNFYQMRRWLHAVFSRRIMNFGGESLAERKRNLDKWQSGQMKVMSHDFLYISKVSLKNWGPLLSPMKDTPATWNDMLGPPWYKKSEDPSGGWTSTWNSTWSPKKSQWLKPRPRFLGISIRVPATAPQAKWQRQKQLQGLWRPGCRLCWGVHICIYLCVCIYIYMITCINIINLSINFHFCVGLSLVG